MRSKDLKWLYKSLLKLVSMADSSPSDDVIDAARIVGQFAPDLAKGALLVTWVERLSVPNPKATDENYSEPLRIDVDTNHLRAFRIDDYRSLSVAVHAASTCYRSILHRADTYSCSISLTLDSTDY